MLGSLHTSDIRRFIPRLIFQDKSTSSTSHSGQTTPIFKLDWDSVDQYKANEYAELKQKYWDDTKTCESARPGTLPPEIDEKVKDLTFALSHDYKRAIEHHTRLFVEERMRQWKFDTVVRERCLKVSASAINVAFYLISDCMYNKESDGWYRGPYKRIYLHAMQYKFWRLYTGRGLVWGKSDLPGLEQIVAQEAKPLYGSALIYNEFMERLKSWDEEQEKFWDFICVPEDTTKIANEDGVVDIGSIPPEDVPEFTQKLKKNLSRDKCEQT